MHELISDNDFLSLSTLSKFATMFLIFETEFWREEKNVEMSNTCHKMKTKMSENVSARCNPRDIREMVCLRTLVTSLLSCVGSQIARRASADAGDCAMR